VLAAGVDCACAAADSAAAAATAARTLMGNSEAII
jgi:hypothetical protein